MNKDMAKGKTGAPQGGQTRGGHPTGQRERLKTAKEK